MVLAVFYVVGIMISGFTLLVGILAILEAIFKRDLEEIASMKPWEFISITIALLVFGTLGLGFCINQLQALCGY